MLDALRQIADAVAREINGDFGPKLDTSYDLYIKGDVGRIDMGDLFRGEYRWEDGTWRLSRNY
jgi:hypothetical protein